MCDELLLECYENLAFAIIKQACDDYRIGEMNDDAFKRFLNSELYDRITTLDSNVLYEKMSRERAEYERKKQSKKHKRKISI